MARVSPEGRRAPVVVLVLAVLGLVAWMTWRTIAVERDHRIAAQSFVQDYANIVADDILRRVVFEFEMFGFLPARQALLSVLDHDKRILSRKELETYRMDRARVAAPVVGQTFAANFATGWLAPKLPPDLRKFVLQDLERVANERLRDEAQQVIRVKLPGRPYWIVYGVGQLQQRRIFGFTVDEEGLRRFARRAMERRPPLAGLAKARLRNDEVFLRVVQDGEEIFRTKGKFDPKYGRRFRASVSYGPIIGDAVVECSIGRTAVSRLVTGGVPPPRWIEAVTMLVITAALLFAVLYGVRRERQLDLLRSDFVSGVSHELRTPLTQIRMFAETLMLNRVRSEEERSRSLRIINQETARLSNLVENLLFFTRGERSALELVRHEHDLSAIARETAASFTGFAQARNVGIRVEGDEEVRATVDADAVKQMLINLLDNAVKYGPVGQVVEVTVSRNGTRATIAVEDRGPGVPEEDRERVWQRFFRLQRDRGTHKAGSGIGLAVVRDLVERHGGRCRVEERAGGGARFVVELPIEEKTDAPHPGD